jgi:hypothetical protein
MTSISKYTCSSLCKFFEQMAPNYISPKPQVIGVLIPRACCSMSGVLGGLGVLVYHNFAMGRVPWYLIYPYQFSALPC